MIDSLDGLAVGSVVGLIDGNSDTFLEGCEDGFWEEDLERSTLG